jgi:hypothetical protein
MFNCLAIVDNRCVYVPSIEFAFTRSPGSYRMLCGHSEPALESSAFHAPSTTSIPTRIAQIVVVVLVVASYVFNAFDLQPYRYTHQYPEYNHNGYANYWGGKGYSPVLCAETFQLDSDLMVMLKVNRSRGASIWENAGLLPGYEDKRVAYPSGAGLQGIWLAAAYRYSHAPLINFLNDVARPSYGILEAVVVMLILFCLLREMNAGTTATLAGGLVATLCDWPVFFARNLTFVGFLLLLPMALGWLLPRYRGAPRKFIYLLIGMSCMVRSLCGYDYMTSVIMSATVGSVYYGLCEGQQWRKLAAAVTRIVAAGMSGLCAAITIHVYQLSRYAGSFAGALQLLHAKATVRMSPFASAGTHHESIWPVAKTAITAYLSVSVIQVPAGSHRLHVPLALLALVQMLVLAACLVRLRKHEAVTRASAAVLTSAWALLCSLSWAVVFPGHMTPHVHFNPILFYIPWIPTLLFALGVLAKDGAHAVRCGHAGSGAMA